MSALLMLAGTPVFFVSEQLMTRHYIEGTFYALVALYLFTTGIRQSSHTRVLLSAVLLFAETWWLASTAFLTLLVLAIHAGRFPWIIVVVSGAMLLGPLYPLAGAPGFTAPDRYFAIS